MAHILLARMDRSLTAAPRHQHARLEVSPFARTAAVQSLRAGSCREAATMRATDVAVMIMMIAKKDWQLGRLPL